MHPYMTLAEEMFKWSKNREDSSACDDFLMPGMAATGTISSKILRAFPADGFKKLSAQALKNLLRRLFWKILHGMAAAILWNDHPNAHPNISDH